MTQQEREKKLIQLASLVGTDAKDPSKNLLSFLQQEIDLAVKAREEEIIGIIDTLERDCLCSPLQTEICDIQRTFIRTQHRIINLIKEKPTC